MNAKVGAQGDLRISMLGIVGDCVCCTTPIITHGQEGRIGEDNGFFPRDLDRRVLVSFLRGAFSSNSIILVTGGCILDDVSAHEPSSKYGVREEILELFQKN